MKQYIINLTNELIGKGRYDLLRNVSHGKPFLDHVKQDIEIGAVADMKPETLGRIMCSFEFGDVMARHLGAEVHFAGDCEAMLREMIALALAYVIKERLDKFDESVPWYNRRRKRDASDMPDDGFVESDRGDGTGLYFMPCG